MKDWCVTYGGNAIFRNMNGMVVATRYHRFFDTEPQADAFAEELAADKMQYNVCKFKLVKTFRYMETPDAPADIIID